MTVCLCLWKCSHLADTAHFCVVGHSGKSARSVSLFQTQAWGFHGNSNQRPLLSRVSGVDSLRAALNRVNGLGGKCACALPDACGLVSAILIIESSTSASSSYSFHNFFVNFFERDIHWKSHSGG